MTEEYRVFTKRFDREVTANELARGRSGLAYAAALEEFDNVAAGWRLPADIAAVTSVGRVRTKIGPDSLEDTVASLLIDHSGSLRGQRAIVAIVLAQVVADYWSRLNVAFDLLGFTTRSWRGGNSRRLWRWTGRRKNPGRLCELLHIVYHAADDSSPGAPWSIRNLLRDDLLKENIDGEAVVWASDRLRRREESRKMLFVVSDGAPVDDSTLMANGTDYLDRHLRQVLSDTSSRNDIEVRGIGLNCDVSGYYGESTRIDSPEDFPTKLVPFIEQSFLQRLSAANN